MMDWDIVFLYRRNINTKYFNLRGFVQRKGARVPRVCFRWGFEFNGAWDKFFFKLSRTTRLKALYILMTKRTARPALCPSRQDSGLAGDNLLNKFYLWWGELRRGGLWWAAGPKSQSNPLYFAGCAGQPLPLLSPLLLRGLVELPSWILKILK